MHVDTVLLARDIDGDGRTDHVVRERRPGRFPETIAHRVAVYLNVAPGARGPHWATAWDEEFGAEATLWRSLPAAAGSWLLGVLGPQADATEEWLLLVQRGSVREEVYHQVDYGEGYADVRRERGVLVVEATQPHVKLRGRAVGAAISCPSSEWPAVRLVFDPQERRFTPERALCMARR
ncbi:MAG TPA: hypothetical protein VNA89_01030 [Gemmatimonadaceae bacterium]|nr:hypothetical protein [Gemmatimonadaceae bacterium]